MQICNLQEALLKPITTPVSNGLYQNLLKIGRSPGEKWPCASELKVPVINTFPAQNLLLFS